MHKFVIYASKSIYIYAGMQIYLYASIQVCKITVDNFMT